MVALATESASPERTCTPKTPIGDQVQLSGLRYYNPELGRWVSRDSIGERDAWLLYLFVHNRPVDRLDGKGRETLPLWGRTRRNGGQPEDPPLRATKNSKTPDCCTANSLNKIIAEYDHVIRKIRKEKGAKCLQSIDCGDCTPHCESCPDTLGYYHRGKITICGAPTSRILAHELEHAWNCGGGACRTGNPAECKKQFLNELRAHVCADKHYGTPCDTTRSDFDSDECHAYVYKSTFGDPLDRSDNWHYQCGECGPVGWDSFANEGSGRVKWRYDIDQIKRECVTYPE